MKKYHRVRYIRTSLMLMLFSLSISLIGYGTASAVTQYPGTFDCASCHGMPPSDSAAGDREVDTGKFKGSHQGHSNSSAGSCVKCHNSAGYQTGHRNGGIEFNATINTLTSSGSYFKGGSPITFTNQTSVPVMGTCSSVNCHFNSDTDSWGTPAYGAPDATTCGKCHDASPSSYMHDAHIAKYTVGGNALTACVKCHIDQTAQPKPFGHATSAMNAVQKVAVSFSVYTGSNFRFLPGQANRKVGSCSNVSCHSPGQNASGGPLGPGDYAMQNWGNAASGACGTCHKATKATITSGSHTKHLNAVGVTGCSECHLDVVGDGTSYESGRHMNTFMNLTGGYSQGGQHALANGYGTCSATSCHDDGTGNSAVTPTWGQSRPACSVCHLQAPTTGSHPAHIADGQACAECHNGAVQGSAYSTQHGDNNIDVYATTPGDLGYLPDKDKGSAYDSCTNASCHDDGTGNLQPTPDWGTAVSDCSQCHQRVPGTGSHIAHMSDPGVTCGKCHNGAVEATTHSTEHLDGDIDVYATAPLDLGYPRDVAKGGANFTSCNNTACHSNPSAAGVLLTSPTWGDSSQTRCNFCHLSRPVSGSHTAHFNKGFSLCSNCHKGALEDSTAPDQHVDGNIDVYKDTANDYLYGANKTVGSAYSTCSAGSCHEDGRNNFVPSPTWGTANNDCSACHAKRPTTGSHTQHVVIGITCGNCHKGASEGTTESVQHMDTNIDVYKTNPGDIGYPIDKVKGSAYQSCNLSSCHGAQSKVWGVTTSNHQCTKCHGQGVTIANYSSARNLQSAPGYAGVGVDTGQQVGNIVSKVSDDPDVGAHDAHLRAQNNLGMPSLCSDCHTVPATAFVAGHMDGSDIPVFSKLVKNLQTTPSSNIPYTWTTTGILSSYNDVTGQCSNIYCHGATLPGGTNKTPIWNDGYYMQGDTSDCGKCHGAPPTTSIRAPHDPGATTCSNCHPHNGSRTPTDPLAGYDFHVNGKLEANKFCDTCHDFDTRGEGGKVWGKNLISVEGYGAHAVHINYLKVRMNITTLNPNVDVYGNSNFNGVCGVCHSRLESSHSQSDRGAPRSITFGETTARQFGSNADYNTWYNGQTGVSSQTTLKTCSNIDCHYKTSPIWQPF